MAAEIGVRAPDFTLYSHDRSQVSLADLAGRKALVVFVPFPFTRTCTSEICDLRDNLTSLGSADANVVVITTDTVASNRAWAAAESVTYPILSDFWPQGATAIAYGCFNEKLGVADRFTYVLDADGVVRDVIESESFGTARNVSSYVASLGAI